jgi:uncharacterized protein YukE
MARIRIDTHRVREVGRRLRAEGDRMSEIGQELGGAIGRLDIWAWDGRSRRRAEPMLNRVRPQSARLSDDLNGLGRTLQRVADLFEQRDNTAARDLGELPWVDFTPGSGGAGYGAAAIGAAGAAAGAIGGGIGAGAGGARITRAGDGVGPVGGGAGPGGGGVGNDDMIATIEEWKQAADIILATGDVTFEQFKLLMESYGVIDEYVLEVLYYHDDAVEILSVSEQWTRWIVKSPVTVSSGWTAFKGSLKKGLTGKLPLIGLAIDLGLTTWDYSDEGLFSNPEYYAALTTDVLFFVGGALVLAGVAALGLVGAPAILATLAASVGWAVVSGWLEEPLTKALTPAFEWIGSQIDSAKDWLGEKVDDAVDWVSDRVGEIGDWFDRLHSPLPGAVW